MKIQIISTKPPQLVNKLTKYKNHDNKIMLKIGPDILYFAPHTKHTSCHGCAIMIFSWSTTDLQRSYKVGGRIIQEG